MGFISDFKVYLFFKIKNIGNTEQHCVNYVYFIMHSEITASAEPSTVPYAKRWQRSGGLQCPYIYRIELADSQREIATRDIQEAVDNAGMSGHVKILQHARKPSGMNTPP